MYVNMSMYLYTHIPTSPCCGFKQNVLSFSGSKLWPHVSMLRSHQMITWKWKFRIKSHWVEMGYYKKDDQISIRIKSHWPLIYWNTGYSENGSRSRRPKLYFCMTFDAFGYCQKMEQSSVAMCLFADLFLYHFSGIRTFTTCSIHDPYFDRAYFITWPCLRWPTSGVGSSLWLKSLGLEWSHWDGCMERTKGWNVKITN